MENNNKKFSNSVSNIVSKASGLGKKAASDITTGAKNISDYTKKALEDQRRKKYNPLFESEYNSDNFRIPKIIEIVDESVRANIDVCEGSIGWTERSNDVDVLHLYDSFISQSGVVFIPYPKCDCIYCVDVFDKNTYINIDNIFQKATNEKLAELEHIAYSLGAKSCSVEIIETNNEVNKSQKGVSLKYNKNSENSELSNSNTLKNTNRGANISYFEGNNTPCAPRLKWFANDDNIVNLVDMRCHGNHSIKSKVLEFSGSATASVSQKVASAIDAMIGAKANISYEKQAVKEHSSKLIFSIEF